MRGVKLIVFFILVTSLLFTCNKEEHWETSVTEISNLTAYGAVITINYDFGEKSRKTIVGIDLGITPDLTNSERIVQEKSNSESIRFEPSSLYANQKYYIRSYMVGRKDTIWSEILSFTTLSETSLPCSVSSGEIYYSSPGLTETVGSLVEIESASDPELFTYEVEAGIGNLTFTFFHEPLSGLYSTEENVYNTYGHSLPLVRVGCWIDNGGSNCYYEANTNERIHVDKDIDGNVSISFCSLTITKDDLGNCDDNQEISGRLAN